MVKMSKELRDALVGCLAIGVCFGAIGTVTVVYPPGVDTPLWVYAVMWTIVPAGSTIGGQWLGRRLYGKTIADRTLETLGIHQQRLDAYRDDMAMLRDLIVKVRNEFAGEKAALERAVDFAEKSIHLEMCTNSACDSEFHK